MNPQIFEIALHLQPAIQTQLIHQAAFERIPENYIAAQAKKSTYLQNGLQLNAPYNILNRPKGCIYSSDLFGTKVSFKKSEPTNILAKLMSSVFW